MSDPTRFDRPVPEPLDSQRPPTTATGPNGLPVVDWPVPAWRRAEAAPPETASPAGGAHRASVDTPDETTSPREDPTTPPRPAPAPGSRLEEVTYPRPEATTKRGRRGRRDRRERRPEAAVDQATAPTGPIPVVSGSLPGVPAASTEPRGPVEDSQALFTRPRSEPPAGTGPMSVADGATGIIRMRRSTGRAPSATGQEFPPAPATGQGLPPAPTAGRGTSPAPTVGPGISSAPTGGVGLPPASTYGAGSVAAGAVALPTGAPSPATTQLPAVGASHPAYPGTFTPASAGTGPLPTVAPSGVEARATGGTEVLGTSPATDAWTGSRTGAGTEVIPSVWGSDSPPPVRGPQEPVGTGAVTTVGGGTIGGAVLGGVRPAEPARAGTHRRRADARPDPDQATQTISRVSAPTVSQESRPGRAPAAPTPRTRPGQARPPKARRAWVYWLVGGLIVLIVGAGGAVVYTTAVDRATQGARDRAHTQVDAQFFGPDKLVAHYLQALEAGDAETAWALAEGVLGYRTADPDWKRTVTPDPGDVLLDNSVYAQVTDRPTDAEVTKVDYDGDTATVHVSYTLGDAQVTDAYQMVRDGTVDQGYSLWGFSKPPVGIIQLTLTSAGKVTVGGKNVTSLLDGKAGDSGTRQGTATMRAFPGTYPVGTAALDKDGNLPKKIEPSTSVTVTDTRTPATLEVSP